jgi:hypothetical protein
MLQGAEEGQRLLLQYLASRESTGQYVVPTSEWVEKLLGATKGLTPEEIDRIKQLDWKPGHVSERELRERIRRALAQSAKPPATDEATAGAGTKPGTKAEAKGAVGGKKGAGKAGGTTGGKPGTTGAEQTPGAHEKAGATEGGTDHAVAPPPGKSRELAGVFPFLITSGMTRSSKLEPGQSVRCRVRIVNRGRVFEVDGVDVTFVGRTDTESVEGNERFVQTTFHIYFTHDFWSEKFQFYGIGGSDVPLDYDWGRHRK